MGHVKWRLRAPVNCRVDRRFGVDVDGAACSDSECAPLAPFEFRLPTARSPFADAAFPVSAVPDLNGAVLAGSGHVPTASAGVNADAGDGAHVREKLNRWVGQVRCPEGDSAVLMSEVDNGVVYVLGHRSARAELCAVFGKKLASGRVLVFEVARITLSKLGWVDDGGSRRTTDASSQWYGRNSSRVGSM